MAGEDDLGPRLSARLTYLLKRALVDLEALHEQHLGPAGISPRELAVLLFLDGREPLDDREAAQLRELFERVASGRARTAEGDEPVDRVKPRGGSRRAGPPARA